MHGIITADDIRSIAGDIDAITCNSADPELRYFVRERGHLVAPVYSAVPSMRYSMIRIGT